MKKTALFASYLFTLLAWFSAPARADGDDDSKEYAAWETSGDLLQFVIPLAGLGVSFFLGQGDEAFKFDLSDLSAAPVISNQGSGLNWPGPSLGGSPRRDFVTAFSRTLTATYGLKYAINAERPNGKDNSFPSGHTSVSFMGAEFIRKHCGNGWGAGAYLAAGWVGWTRVFSKNHYWRDVVAGAAIGIASNYDFDTVETKYGTLSFGPALIESRAALWEGQAHQLQEIQWQPNLATSVPGIMLEWKF